MARKKLGELTESDIAAGAARAQRLCSQIPDECRSACRAGVMETERQLREHPTVVRKRPVVMDGIKLCMSEYKDEAARFACSAGVRFGISASKGRKRRR